MSHARTIMIGALCATALCVGGLIGPPGAALALLAAPLPILVVGGAAGALNAAVSSLTAGSLMGGLLGWPVGLVFLAFAGGPATLVTLMLRRAWRFEQALAAATAVTAVGGMALLLCLMPNVGAWGDALTAAWRASFDSA